MGRKMSKEHAGATIISSRPCEITGEDCHRFSDPDKCPVLNRLAKMGPAFRGEVEVVVIPPDNECRIIRSPLKEKQKKALIFHLRGKWGTPRF